MVQYLAVVLLLFVAYGTLVNDVGSTLVFMAASLFFWALNPVWETQAALEGRSAWEV